MHSSYCITQSDVFVKEECRDVTKGDASGGLHIVVYIISMTITGIYCSGAFLAAAVWGGQWGGHIFIWGARILDDIMHD